MRAPAEVVSPAGADQIQMEVQTDQGENDLDQQRES